MLDYLTGMHYLHAEAPVKVIHRDLKSRNGLFLKLLLFLMKIYTNNPRFSLLFVCLLAILVCQYFISLSYGFSVLSSTVVMTADRVLKVCNSGLVMYGQPHIINFHLIQALRSFCVFITVLTVGIFRFVTLGHPSSSPIPPT